MFIFIITFTIESSAEAGKDQVNIETQKAGYETIAKQLYPSCTQSA